MDDLSSQTSEQIAERWVRYLAMFDVQIDPRQPLGEIGIDSLTAAELSAELEDEFGFILPMDRFFGERTLLDLAGEVRSGSAEAS